jgi:hypothetical protein
VAVNTAKAWLSVLEATFQVMVLRPFFANVGKRLVKTLVHPGDVKLPLSPGVTALPFAAL